MVFILKGGRSSSGTPSKQSGFTSFNRLPKGYEDSLLGEKGKIARGDLTDYDIDFIVDHSGDRKLQGALERKYEKEKSNSEHIKRVYGDAWDNKDNEGNLFKCVDSDVSMGKNNYDPAQGAKMEKIINKNSGAQ